MNFALIMCIDLRSSLKRWQILSPIGRQGLRMKKQIKMPKYGQCFAMGLGEPSEQEQLLCWSHNPNVKLYMRVCLISVVQIILLTTKRCFWLFGSYKQWE